MSDVIPFSEIKKELENDSKLNSGDIDFIKASDIKPKAIQWLWLNRIPRGKVTVFAGEPGVGKSQLLLYLASLVSQGASFPLDNFTFPEGNIAILSAEDDAADTMVPRLKAVNANLDKIYFFNGTKDFDINGNPITSGIALDRDLTKIDKVIEKIGGFSLFIVDPISAYLGNINDHKNSEVRALLSQITAFALKHNLAAILNTHLTKPKGGITTQSAINRVNGSVAYVAAARAAYLVCKDQQNPDKRLFLPIKNNIGNDKDGFAYEIKTVELEDEIITSHVEWLPGVITTTANEALDEQSADKKTKLDEAKEFLLEYLKDGSKPIKDILVASQAIFISQATLYRAKKELKIGEGQSVNRSWGRIWFLGVDTVLNSDSQENPALRS